MRCKPTLPAFLAALLFAALLPGAPGVAATGTPGRLLAVEYSDALDSRPARLVAPADADIAPTREGLAGRRVGVQRETLHHCLAERLFPEARLRLFDTQAQGFDALAAGEIDALVADAVAAYRHFLSTATGGAFRFLGDELFDRACDELGLAGRAPPEPALKERLDDALGDLKRDGTLEALGRKYFHRDSDE